MSIASQSEQEVLKREVLELKRKMNEPGCSSHKGLAKGKKRIPRDLTVSKL